MEDAIQFKDFNLKLIVIEELMYRQSVLRPRFDLQALAESSALPEGDNSPTETGIATAALAYFQQLQLTTRHLLEVTELVFDAALTIYQQIHPNWNGPDATFEVRSLEDLALLPNLRRVYLNSMIDPEMAEVELGRRGIEIV
jgi:Family of unknown function (DUF6892)